MTEFHNPNQEPGGERRLLIVFAVTFLILMAFQPLMNKYVRKAAPHPAEPASTTGVQPTAAASSAPRAMPAATAAVTAKQAAAEAETVVENDLYRITFTNRGAQVKSWVLKKFTDDKGAPLELVNNVAQVETQQDGQMIWQPAAAAYGYPMSLWTYDPGLRGKLNSALYTSSATGHLASPADLTFEYSDGGTVVRKTFHFDNSYIIRIQTQVTSGGQVVTALPMWPAGFGDQVLPTSYAATRIAYHTEDNVKRLEPKKVSGGSTIRGAINWAGLADPYFGAVFLPDNPADTSIVTLHESAAIPKNPDKPDTKDVAVVPLLGTAVGSASGATNGRWFVGPKAVDVIDSIKSAPAPGQAVGPSLAGLVDFGFFGFVGKPLFLWLKWTHQHMVSNWGWSIALLTIIINLALLPLRVTSMKSALKMQKIQPMINDIKKKYEKYSLKDPRKAQMNQEIGGLFKEHGVNPPAAACPC